eukprot:gene22452-29567_t
MGNGQLIPVVDLANHRRNCPNLVSSDVENGVMQFHAGEEIGAGTEICLSYHPSLRDDFAFIHYGFLPEEECPPRLFMEDHVEFDEMFLEYQPFQAGPSSRFGVFNPALCLRVCDLGAPSHEVAEAEDKQRKDREQEAARDWFPELVDWNLRKKFTALKKWVTDHKGTVGATMGVEESGARTLLAAQDFKAGQEIVVVTTDTIISIWKFEGVVYFQKFVTPTYYQPYSFNADVVYIHKCITTTYYQAHPFNADVKFVTPTYYQKYVDMMPSLDMNELTNVCNLQKKYHPLLQSNHWAATVVNWQNDMDRQLVNSSRYKNAVRLLEVPIREYMTSDLQRACTMTVSRRVFNTLNHKAMLLLPISTTHGL